MWNRTLEPFITLIPFARFQPIVFNHPLHPTSIHIGIYLPTAGLETEFVHKISTMEAAINDMLNDYPGATVFLQGDTIASFTPRSGNKRDILFQS